MGMQGSYTMMACIIKANIRIKRNMGVENMFTMTEGLKMGSGRMDSLSNHDIGSI